MKASLLLCACSFAIGTQLLGCGDQPGLTEADVEHTSGAPESAAGAEPRAEPAESAKAAGSAAGADCAELSPERNRCGQISLTMKGVGSSCQLLPTANDLTRPPRSIWLDCSEIARGPNGYDFDPLGHITLLGRTCEALTEDGPHRVTLLLSCPPQ